MTAQEFFDKYNNQGIDYDHAYGFQCVDLYDQYCVEVVGAPVILVGGAVNIWDSYPTDFFEKIPNTPSGVPQLGDVVIWSTGVGPNGHVAVFKEGDANQFTSFDQNWPVNSLCHFQQHNYNSVLGWLRPKVQQPTEPMATITQKELDQIRHDRDQHYNDLQAALAQVTQLTVKLTNLQHEYNDYQQSHPLIASNPVPQPSPSNQPILPNTDDGTNKTGGSNPLILLWNWLFGHTGK